MPRFLDAQLGMCGQFLSKKRHRVTKKRLGAIGVPVLSPTQPFLPWLPVGSRLPHLTPSLPSLDRSRPPGSAAPRDRGGGRCRATWRKTTTSAARPEGGGAGRKPGSPVGAGGWMEGTLLSAMPGMRDVLEETCWEKFQTVFFAVSSCSKQKAHQIACVARLFSENIFEVPKTCRHPGNPTSAARQAAGPECSAWSPEAGAPKWTERKSS